MQPIPLSKPMTPELARAIYAVLLAAWGDDPEYRTASDESMFIPAIAQGGLLKLKYLGAIGCFNIFVMKSEIWIRLISPETPKRLAAIERTMRALAVLMESK